MRRRCRSHDCWYSSTAHQVGWRRITNRPDTNQGIQRNWQRSLFVEISFDVAQKASFATHHPNLTSTELITMLRIRRAFFQQPSVNCPGDVIGSFWLVASDNAI